MTEPKEVANLLNTLLADEYVIYTKTKNVHGSIMGQNFTEIPNFFENHFEQLFKIIDGVEDKVKMLGHVVISSFKDLLSFTHFNKRTVDFTDKNEMIQTLIADHETMINVISNDIKPVTEKYNDNRINDFVASVKVQHEEMARTLKIHLN